MIGKEDLVVLVNLSRLVAAKMDEPILHVRDWINGRIAVAVVMSYSQTILDIDSQVPCGTRILTGTCHWALGWRNKLRAIIILRSHP